MKHDRYVDILTGIVVGATVGVFFPLSVGYIPLLVLASVILGVRLLITTK
jgi:uncharacterized membrane protein YoaK (UPF0700 family)